MHAHVRVCFGLGLNVVAINVIKLFGCARVCVGLGLNVVAINVIKLLGYSISRVVYLALYFGTKVTPQPSGLSYLIRLCLIKYEQSNMCIWAFK